MSNYIFDVGSISNSWIALLSQCIDIPWPEPLGKVVTVRNCVYRYAGLTATPEPILRLLFTKASFIIQKWGQNHQIKHSGITKSSIQHWIPSNQFTSDLDLFFNHFHQLFRGVLSAGLFVVPDILQIDPASCKTKIDLNFNVPCISLIMLWINWWWELYLFFQWLFEISK